MNAGARLTEWTLFHAVESSSLSLVQLVLSQGADISACTPTGQTPLGSAIRLQDSQIIQTLQAHGAMATLNDYAQFDLFGAEPRHFGAALKAALGAQDESLIQYLINLGNQNPQNDLNPAVDLKWKCYTAALRIAIKVGETSFIRDLLDVNSNYRPNDETYAFESGYVLTIAISHGRRELAINMIDAGADVNSGTPMSKPLEAALKQRDATLVRRLIAADADPSDTIFSGPSNISLAAEWGDRSLVHDLILAGVDVSSPSYGCDTPLNIATRRGDQGIVRLLIEAGACINENKLSFDDDPTTPLQCAVQGEDIGLTRTLLDCGADPNNEIAFEYAAWKNADLLDLLLASYKMRYPKTKMRLGSRLLAVAIRTYDEKLFQLLLHRGVSTDVMMYTVEVERKFPGNHLQTSARPIDHPNASLNLSRSKPSEDTLRMTALGWAILVSREDNLKATTLLLSAGSSPNGIVCEARILAGGRLTSNMITALVAAISTRNLLTVNLLLENGADVNLRPCRSTRTPLQGAAELGDLILVQRLIDRGAEINAPAARKGGGTALQLAAIGRFIPVIQLLLKFKAKVDAPAGLIDGRTALEGAAEHGRLDTVALLLGAGAGGWGDDKKQFARATKFARENGHGAVCDLLEDHLNEHTMDPLDMLVDDDDGKLYE